MNGFPILISAIFIGFGLQFFAGFILKSDKALFPTAIASLAIIGCAWVYASCFSPDMKVFFR